MFVHLAPELWSKMAGLICLLYDLAWNVIKPNPVDKYFTGHFLRMEEKGNTHLNPALEETFKILIFSHFQS